MTDNIVLRIDNLHVAFGNREVIKSVSIELRKGEMLALVGESGSGKTVTCRALLGLEPVGASVSYDVLRRPEPHRMSLVMQNAMTALDPAMPVWKQIIEGTALAKSDAIDLLRSVGIDSPEIRAKQYPPHFSGGMRQRSAVAVALAMTPDVIFADEPTTSLDADMRMQIMELLSSLRNDNDTSVLFVTHDLNLVRNFADRVLIMKAGEIIEQGTANQLFENPQTDYTRELLHYSQYHHEKEHVHGDHTRTLSGGTLIEAVNIGKVYELPNRKTHRVLHDVNISVCKGEIVGLCGRSGIGKSTLARILANIERPTTGAVRHNDDLRIQMIFQDNVSALNPHMRIEQIIAEPLLLRDGKRPAKDKVLELMRQCELEPELASRRPDKISGGQRQRVAIARAISTDPELIIADEPVSSLDVTTCSRIIHLLWKIQRERGLSIFLISHDLPLLNHVCDRIIAL